MGQAKNWVVRQLSIAGIALAAAAPAQAATIGIQENLPPFSLAATNPSGQRGIYPDMADAIVARSKIPIEIKFMPYGRMLQELKTGGVDYAFGIVSPAIAEAGPFIATVAKVPMVAAARKGLALHKLEDLHNFTEVGYLRGGSCGPLVDGDAAIHRVSQDNYDSAIHKLAAGRLDGWCSIKAGFVYALNALKMTSEIGDQLEYGEVKMGFQVTGGKAGSAEAKEMAAVVEKIVSEGGTGQIFTHYVGAPYLP
jgi:polar amino acid transport system substrate-binding protein